MLSERKTAVSHTVLAAARLGPRAYASSGLRQAFANPTAWFTLMRESLDSNK